MQLNQSTQNNCEVTNMTPTLQGSLVTLRPLLETDAQLLIDAAADGELWSLPFTVVPSADTADSYIQKALKGQIEGTVMPFAVTLSSDQRVIGSTRFWKIDRENRKLEIGHTWYSQSWQKTAANTESKLLLLRYAFEQLSIFRGPLALQIPLLVHSRPFALHRNLNLFFRKWPFTSPLTPAHQVERFP
ncbi:GNAT family N-acetyltransferase [Citrobacter portucalensis]|uniref:GNAT family N-acetyltransferase n=1 Tax=Citrobacter portucalensis TaxID=1639133 RepID=UPI00333530B0